MTKSAVTAVLLATVLATASHAVARAPTPATVAALVEDVKSASASVEFMDYVGPGQVITLASSDLLVLSYFKSCQHETITGGTVRIGSEKSEVEGGNVVRITVPCNGGTMRLSAQQANASGASSFRLQNATFETTVHALPPVIEIPRMRAGESRTLVVERANRPKERIAVEIDDALATDGGFYDLSKSGMQLQPGALYTASIGDRTLNFRVARGAKLAKPAKAAKPADTTGKTPMLSRLLRFPSG
jgi:hypothetical protein